MDYETSLLPNVFPLHLEDGSQAPTTGSKRKACLKDLAEWMIYNKLKTNMQTNLRHFLLIPSDQHWRCVNNVRNLEVIVDHELSMTA